ncbi:hypothetical protein KOAAANKH_02976 [Brevundimonas sp. NIBR10]|uniref:hypothetical protein n=1 Tax=Brevundimonas sp. NIBR10 TaxID=3015997 RepID=UPI0022F16088|nr:hypothetical protein [Brevundimonas sp. NIBR10]WGM48087.1 hypothetical protein KOAAANKH_02976 [Brevundimonas sp. NIBR10]
MAVGTPNSFADELPKLSVRQLKGAKVAFAHGQELVFESAGLRFVTKSIDGTSALIVWKDEGEYRHQAIDFTGIDLRHGERPAFACPVTGKACYDLYLYRYVWASAKGHGRPRATKLGNRYDRQQVQLEAIRNRLMGLEGLPKVRGARRRALVKKAQAIPWGTRVFPELDAIAVEIDRVDGKRVARAYRSKRSDSPYSTEVALRLAQRHELAPTELGAAELLNRLGHDGLAAAHNVAVPGRPLRKLESVPALDARVLSRLWARDRVWSTALAWPDMATGAVSIWWLATDLRDQACLIAGIRPFGSNDADVQRLELRQAGAYKPNNLVFVCPILGTRHDILYLRDGFFASAKAHRLVHASQRG